MVERRLFTVGDVNAFFALLVDNVVNLVMLSGILVGVFGFPQSFVMEFMIPGTALGVMIGDLAYTYLAVRGGASMTAMPLGLDTPSTVGVALAVIGPTYSVSQDPYTAWGVGMATLVLMGIVKVILAFFGDIVTRIVPRAGLLGPIAGVGIALLGLFPMMKVFSVPVVGLVATGIILYSLIAKTTLPYKIPGALFAVIVGLIIYWICALFDFIHLGSIHTHEVHADIVFAIPQFRVDLMWEGFEKALDFLPLSVPFGLLTIVGGINVTESARVAGDNYRTRDILLVEAFATLIAGFFGGVAQSTPYIGHPAYKAMGAKAGYTLMTGLTIGLGGCLGVLSVIIGILPEMVVAPILLFVGLEITVQAFSATDRRYLPAVSFAIIPTLGYLVSIYTGQLVQSGASVPPQLKVDVETLSLLGNGFILTAMLWGMALTHIIDKSKWQILVTFGILAIFSLFGVVHSIYPDGRLYFPSTDSMKSVEIAIAYGVTGIVVWTMCMARGGQEGSS